MVEASSNATCMSRILEWSISQYISSTKSSIRFPFAVRESHLLEPIFRQPAHCRPLSVWFFAFSAHVLTPMTGVPTTQAGGDSVLACAHMLRSMADKCALLERHIMQHLSAKANEYVSVDRLDQFVF